MTNKKHLHFPAQVAAAGRVCDSPILHLQSAARMVECDIEPFKVGRIDVHLLTTSDGQKVVLVPRVVNIKSVPHPVLMCPHPKLLESDSNTRAKWLSPRPAVIKDETAKAGSKRAESVRESWQGQFSFCEEERAGGVVRAGGLRPPQVGALFGVLSHWRATEDPCTVVMPTGTGKTETMLALFARERLERLLVVVPTDALREQITNKFLSWGMLKSSGVIGSGALYPVVGTLVRRPKTVKEVEDYFARCNVVVTTMSVVGGCKPDVQSAIARVCSHLFIDEAHHIVARTWSAFRQTFKARRIVQFTATPFRGDGRYVDGKVVFSYPVRKAQEDGYFRPVTFRPVTIYIPEQADAAIAQAALTQLRKDLKQGHNHVIMARAKDTARAEAVYSQYERLGSEFKPVVIHSRLDRRAREDGLHKLRSGKSRVLVCVNMFGEGFDMPELKIAAMHDIHKGLAVTLQFTGRFTRSRTDIGDATLIANIAEADVEESLQELYSHGANWNSLLQELSQGATAVQAERGEFLAGFADSPVEIALQNIYPKMSTVVFRTKCRRWKPDNLDQAVKEHRLFAGPSVNEARKVLFFVTRETTPVEWGVVQEIRDTAFDLYLVHWDQKNSLLYIHSSNKSSMHDDIAAAVAGEDADLIRGEQMFRVFHGLTRFMPMNLGLRHALERAIRFTMHVGGDIADGLTQSHVENKTKSNLFGRGFEGGAKATVGCSYRGRVWSYQVAHDISNWVEWCHHIGAKLLDESISVADVLKGVILPKTIKDRPALVPLMIEWNEDLFMRGEEEVQLECVGKKATLLDTELELSDHNVTGPLTFKVVTNGWTAEYLIRFHNERVEYVPTGKLIASMTVGRKTAPLTDWLRTFPPVVRFVNGAFLEHNELFQPFEGTRQPFDPAQIEAWDWSGVDPRKESQTQAKLTDSIQFRVLRTLLADDHKPHYDIVFDDDEKGEAADVVAMAASGDRLIVHLFHCKYAKSTEGSRVKDLYEVCGQVQRSVYWRGQVDQLFEHLKAREATRQKRGGVSRFERGDLPKLVELARRSRFLAPEFRVFLVQPGLSKSAASSGQRDLLATTELYLRETFAVPLTVIGAA